MRRDAGIWVLVIILSLIGGVSLWVVMRQVPDPPVVVAPASPVVVIIAPVSPSPVLVTPTATPTVVREPLVEVTATTRTPSTATLVPTLIHPPTLESTPRPERSPIQKGSHEALPS